MFFSSFASLDTPAHFHYFWDLDLGTFFSHMLSLAIFSSFMFSLSHYATSSTTDTKYPITAKGLLFLCHTKKITWKADYYLTVCFIIWERCQYFCSWVFKRCLNDSYQLFLPVSRNVFSVVQEFFSQLLLQDMVGHSPAQELAEKKL